MLDLLCGLAARLPFLPNVLLGSFCFLCIGK
jgi:hypothetical protein